MSRQYTTEFEVRGGGQFPVDMLEKEHCKPARCYDDWAIRASGNDRWYQLRVRLTCTHSRGKKWKPDPKVWMQAGWQVDRSTIKTARIP